MYPAKKSSRYLCAAEPFVRALTKRNAGLQARLREELAKLQVGGVYVYHRYINSSNASVVAKELGIRVSCRRIPAGDHSEIHFRRVA